MVKESLLKLAFLYLKIGCSRTFLTLLLIVFDTDSAELFTC